MPGLSGRILVVDDSKVIRQLIRVNLELEGFEVVTAADGAECLDVVHHVRPDVVTLDVVMPRLNGLRTAARLRSDPRTWDIPIAIVSACTQGEVDSGESVGVDAFLTKPFEPTELVRTVGRLVQEGRRAEPEGGAPGRSAAERAELVRQQPGPAEHDGRTDCGEPLDQQERFDRRDRHGHHGQAGRHGRTGT
ncbi:response regulator [Streptomyces pinistramenti]|uniref:response regulator n=1 Tax=Streptomyces pinistramenti TaxID=2884812 RepID=UPI001D067F6D|nr:response regulator [Streptomyces pinistramenti]MCB5910907.1 response regulator [Streptomyces pinistramenti]